MEAVRDGITPNLPLGQDVLDDGLDVGIIALGHVHDGPRSGLVSNGVR